MRKVGISKEVHNMSDIGRFLRRLLCPHSDRVIIGLGNGTDGRLHMHKLCAKCGTLFDVSVKSSGVKHGIWGWTDADKDRARFVNGKLGKYIRGPLLQEVRG